MKNNITLLFILFTLSGFSQQSGEIIYSELVNTKPDMAKAEEQGWSQWAEMVPETMTFKKLLIYNDSISMYSNIKEEVDPNEPNMVKRMARRFSNSNSQTYRNTPTEIYIEQKDFMGKSFLIEGKAKETKWKMTGKMKIIMSYPCLKAVYSDSTETLEAWFTTEIPVSVGPENYGGLPGMILEITSKKNKKTLTAIAIDFKKLDEEALKKPIDGKEVTREEYQQIVKKKMKEMRENGSWGGH